MKRYAGSSGKPVCDDDDPCERGYIDFTLGQNASISGGSLKHLLFNVDSIYPLRVPGVNFLYLFGSVSKRIWNLPPDSVTARSWLERRARRRGRTRHTW